MNTDPFNRPDEFRAPKVPPKPNPCPVGHRGINEDTKVGAWWVAAVLGFIAWFMISALSGCAQVSETVGEYRDNHEAVVAFEVRGGLFWVGFGVRSVGKQAEIEILEGEKPYQK